MEFCVAPPAMYSTSNCLVMSSYMGACLSSARIASLSLTPYLSRNSWGTTAEMSSRGLPMPRSTPARPPDSRVGACAVVQSFAGRVTETKTTTKVSGTWRKDGTAVSDEARGVRGRSRSTKSVESRRRVRDAFRSRRDRAEPIDATGVGIPGVSSTRSRAHHCYGGVWGKWECAEKCQRRAPEAPRESDDVSAEAAGKPILRPRAIVHFLQTVTE